MSNNDYRIFVRVDHAQFTAQQIFTHEITHDKIGKGEIDVDAVRARIRKKLNDDTRYEELAGVYIEAYMTVVEIDDTVQYRNDTKTRKQIVTGAQKNAASIGKTDGNGGVTVYVDDI